MGQTDVKLSFEETEIVLSLRGDPWGRPAQKADRLPPLMEGWKTHVRP